ncbi:hypothetical protein CBD41_05680 [bacterium TMED181]|nr:hypothetical protein [Planctomycetota bacterium]OUW44442.1 MAG: hypothetical protein CBD41_05680 [bacterium TMED181]
MKSFIAFLKAVRFLWISFYWISLIVLLGFYEWVSTHLISTENFFRIIGVLMIGGLLIEHYLGVVTRKRQSIMARSLIQLQPGLRHDGAVSILIDALENSEPATAQTIHKELVRLTGQDFGLQPTAWRAWLRKQEQKVQGSQILARQLAENDRDPAEEGDPA